MRAVVSWSGGKDAALARRVLARDPGVEVVGLLSELAGARTKGHRLRPGLVERQAEALDLPLTFVELPESPPNDRYERVLRDVLDALDADAVAYADLHLREVRDYREELLATTEIEGVWPLWDRSPGAVLDAFLDGGDAVVCAANEGLGPEAVGRDLRALVAALPEDVDPTGEGGEYHTFVTDDPGFDRSIGVAIGEPFTEDGHAGRIHYRDLRVV